MKLYIPTSTLNFNNILSTESLSPQAFYAHRDFGYKRWTSIPENGLANAILLYDRPFHFSRPASDVEDHPMWIEIETDEEFTSVADGIRLSDHTIYLSPWRTHFFFLTEADLRTTQSLTQQSAETKLTPLYSRHMKLRNDYPTTPSLDIPKNKVNLNMEAINYDCRINKLKGLLYGYYLGALFSEAPAIANLRLQLLTLRNNFYARWSASFLNQKGAKTLHPETQKMFDYLWKKKLSLSDLFNAWLEDEWERLDLRAATERNLLSTKNEEIIVADNRLAKISPNVLSDEWENKLFMAWANDVFIHPEYTGDPATFREALSDTLTQTACNLLSTQWENSVLRTQLNAMRHLVRGNDNHFLWANTLTSAAAAVLLWGDDWENLRSKLREKGTIDFRLAFALYGELTGFANLTRDFTDHLFKLDRQYVADVYKELYGELHGTAADIPSSPQKDTNTTTRNTEETITPKNIGDFSASDLLKNLKERILRIYEYLKKSKAQNKDILIEELKEVELEMCDTETPPSFLNKLSKKDNWKKKRPVLKKAEEILGIPKEQKVKTPQVRNCSNEQKELFQETGELAQKVCAELKELRNAQQTDNHH